MTEQQTAEHTPGRIKVYQPDARDRPGLEFEQGCATLVVWGDRAEEGDDCGVRGSGPGVGLANAKRLALAWNCHDDLLAALRGLLIETDQHAEGDCPKLLAACTTARDQIALAAV